MTLCETESFDDGGQPRRGVDAAGNGRFVRNVIEAAEEEREYRLSSDHGADVANLDETALMRIELGDVQAALKNVLGMLSPH